MRLVGRRGRIVRLSVLQWRYAEAGFAELPPGPQWGVTFANGRSSTRAFHAFQRVGVDESLRRARIQESNTAVQAASMGEGTSVVYLEPARINQETETREIGREGTICYQSDVFFKLHMKNVKYNSIWN